MSATSPPRSEILAAAYSNIGRLEIGKRTHIQRGAESVFAEIDNR